MFPVYLLENNSQQRNIYAQFIDTTIMIEQLPMKLVLKTSSFDDLLEALDGIYHGLFFLNIQIDDNKLAGIEVAETIKSKVPGAIIIFITSHEQLALLTLEKKIAPMDFIIKGKGIEHIKNNIKDDLIRINDLFKYYQYEKENIFSYKVGSNYFSVAVDEVIYLSTDKSNPGKVILRSLNGEHDFYGNLNDIAAKYPMFFRSDKSYLVNLDLLDCFDAEDKKLYFVDGSVAHISFRKSRELIKILKNS